MHKHCLFRLFACCLAVMLALSASVFAAGIAELTLDSDDSESWTLSLGDGKSKNSEISDEQFSKVSSKYRGYLNIGLGVLAVTTFLIMIFQFVKLGYAGSNPAERKKAITGILFSGIATALFGGLAVVVSIFASAFAV